MPAMDKFEALKVTGERHAYGKELPGSIIPARAGDQKTDTALNHYTAATATHWVSLTTTAASGDRQSQWLSAALN
ncbi:hypothetical protein PG996_001633 [Apiospora saccharicola]|uniref:Uncharacterized protein n=1 Tax=Apiospora saccharicola TaxID=335842 RepID=A0ABR1WIL9_9PEZI